MMISGGCSEAYGSNADLGLEDQGSLEWDRLLILLKGNEGDVRDSVKIPAILTVMAFMNRVLGTAVREGRFTYAMPLPSQPGDIEWMKENVFRFCDPVGTVIQDVEAKADRMMDLFVKAEGTADKAGWNIIVYWLEQWMMRYDMWEEC